MKIGYKNGLINVKSSFCINFKNLPHRQLILMHLEDFTTQTLMYAS